MPVIDLFSDATSFPDLGCDICIVGSGPAGATLAAELSGSTARVIVLESGGPERRNDCDDLDAIESVGRARAEQWSVRNRIVGGSSHTWGGRCAPFDEIDFEARPWVPASGWPFPAEELTPFLDRSAAHLGLSPGSGFSDEGFWQMAGRRPGADPDPARLRSFFWQHSRDPQESYPYEYMRFGRGIGARMGQNTALVSGATVLKIRTTESGTAVTGVDFAGPDGTVRTLTASMVVLCAGGIENARMLLVSDGAGPGGLGNRHDLVGRYLMDHLRGPLGAFDPDGTIALQKRFGRYNVNGRFFRAGFRLAPQVQRDEGLLNCAAWLGEILSADDPWDQMRGLLRGRLRGLDARQLMANAGLFAGSARDYFLEGNGIRRRLSGLDLLGMVEQRPDPDSRVTLSDRRDRFGMPVARIDWRSNPDESRTMCRMAQLVAAELPRMGFAAPALVEWVRDGALMPDSFVDVAHPTGTTRMSDSPSTGVVDPTGMVHGIEGLYVSGSSTFPTAGHCNPTQMIVALAIRLADRLRMQQQRMVPASVSGPAMSGATAVPQDPTRTTVLVTGATGRIGRVLTADLLARGYRVRATTSRPLGVAGTVAGHGVEWRQFDFLKDEDFETLLAGCDAVLHLAAEIGDADRMARVNAEATDRLSRAAERLRAGGAGPRAFCYVSTVSVYGSGRRRVIAEEAPVLTVERDIPSEYWALRYVRTYGRTKLAGELAVRCNAALVPCIILRPAVVVDVDALIGIRKWHWTKRMLAAHRHAHHIFVHDVSDAIIWSMERMLSGGADAGQVETYNLSEDDFPEPTHADFMRKAYAASGDTRFRVVPMPWVGDWLHDFLRFRTLPLRNPLWRMRFPSDRLRAAGYRLQFGMAHAQARALENLRHERQRETGDTE
ncbi:NAD-dependent epimerase/dehydratase family protein (plasmid) [Paracoccus liaowanqingii]|uniref:NAD-dependent epimerase/dehydratase family protein n=1 Tax=Paracoccus liaowanqingii TaxID=2560053 RepID=A0A4Y5SVA4_9RHOB|nr:GMC oxidoreductase [Paracoccus liaowanqingii]QDA36788.1 NAD-dependent epimerase/dehydratase family protein [Paracoccus liaowanqingii]